MQKASKLIVVNAAPYETRVATLESGILVELLIERGEDRNSVGNIYNGKVIRVLPGCRPPSSTSGWTRRGSSSPATSSRRSSSSTPTRPRSRSCPREIGIRQARFPQDTFVSPDRGPHPEGQHLLVQVAKEPLGTKGARITSHTTLPGRHLVLLTWSSNIGISRRIEDPEERDRLSKIVEAIRPEGMGAIVRTAAEGRSEAELKADMDYLVRLWETIRKEKRKHRGPVLIHRELSLSLRAGRDLFSSENDRIAVDSQEEYERNPLVRLPVLPPHPGPDRAVHRTGADLRPLRHRDRGHPGARQEGVAEERAATS